MDPTTIRNWQRLSDEVTTSGRLLDSNLAKLLELGVRKVINLAPEDHPEALPEEGPKLAALGIAYRHIPVPFEDPADHHYSAFVEAFAAAKRPVHVHCIANWRVSAFFYRYHREGGMPEAEARRMLQRQWDPVASDHPIAQPWKQFIDSVRESTIDPQGVQ